MRKTVILLLAALALTVASMAQGPVAVAPQNIPDRGEALVAVFDGPPNGLSSGQSRYLGLVSIHHGRPVWQDSYDKDFDKMTQGQLWRLGSNFWTVLDTGLALEVGGARIPAGTYYLLTYRSQDGSDWELAFIDPSQVRTSTPPFAVGAAASVAPVAGVSAADIPILYRAPLRFRKTGQKVDKLDITLSNAGEGIVSPQGKVKLTIAWGDFQLSSDVQVRSGASAAISE